MINKLRKFNLTPYNDNCIFGYVKPNGNDKFSALKGLDLQDLLWHINRCYLEMRKKLGFLENVTFGIEIEAEHSKKNKITNEIDDSYCDWNVKGDGSLTNGIEVNSPILEDSIESWRDVEGICNIISNNAKVDKNTGGHIHIGAHILGDKPECWLNFLRLWSTYENVIYRFSYGEFLVARPAIKRYAKPASKSINQVVNILCEKMPSDFLEVIRPLMYERYQGVNFNNVTCDNFNDGNTIEFRCPNGTLDPVIWQNNVNVFVNLLKYCCSTYYDGDIIEKRSSEVKDINGDILMYNEIYLEQTLEFCDMIFTSNIDKIYFLRQYLKAYEISFKEFDKAKKFTKISKVK